LGYLYNKLHIKHCRSLPIIAEHCRMMPNNADADFNVLRHVRYTELSTSFLDGFSLSGTGPPAKFSHLGRVGDSRAEMLFQSSSRFSRRVISTDFYCLRVAKSMPTIFHRGGRKQAVIFRSWCVGRVFSMDCHCLTVAQSISAGGQVRKATSECRSRGGHLVMPLGYDVI